MAEYFPQDEKALAAQRAVVQALAAGDLYRALREMADSPAVRRYQQLRDRLVRLNLSVVDIHIAHLTTAALAHGVDPDELRGIGLWALLHAADRLDPSLGRYRTFADRWVRNEMRKFIVRAKQRATIEYVDADDQSETNTDAQTPESFVEASRLATALGEIAGRCPKAAEVLQGRLRGESHSEIGRRLGFSKVRSRVLEQREIPRLQKTLRRSA